jgi:putative addiction module component (TIGR02574 family)
MVRSRGSKDELSLSARILRLQDEWDEISRHESEITLSAAQRAELDRRLAAYRENPKLVLTWSEVRASLVKRPKKRRRDSD